MRVDVRLIDQEVYRWMSGRANDDQVHVVALEMPGELNCSLRTVYRSLKRLKDAGYIKQLDGSRRNGYTYRICA